MRVAVVGGGPTSRHSPRSACSGAHQVRAGSRSAGVAFTRRRDSRHRPFAFASRRRGPRSLVKYCLIIDEFGGWARFQHLLEVLDAVATRHGVGIGAVAIRWVLDQPGVAGVIVGARHARHLDDTVKACAVALDAEDHDAIARVQAASSGPAGEVYALERVKGGPHAAIMRYALNRDTTAAE